MISDFNLPTIFNIDKDCFFTLVYEAQRLYDFRKNPFHNFTHGMTVMHQTYWLLKKTKLGTYYDDLGKYALLFASLMHDVDHRGRTNVFEANSLSELALVHNDRSILENHHCSTAFLLIKQSKYNIVEKLTYEQLISFRKIVIESILSTDVKRHFEIIDAFEKKIEDPSFNPNFYENQTDFNLLSGMVIHTCDLYVPTRKLPDAIRWSALVNKEFIEQNKEEQARKLPEVPFYKNLEKPEVMGKSEKFFVEKIVSPLWKHLDTFLEGKLKNHKENIVACVDYWDKFLKPFTNPN
jgi:cAMP-specific phosphodiesterase 4